METTSIFLSIVATITAIVGVVLSVIQISHANSLSLFDRRLRVYQTIKWMVTLCKDNQKLVGECLDGGKQVLPPDCDIHVLFEKMCCCPYLEEAIGVLDADDDDRSRRTFLFKLQELRDLSVEVGIIYRNNVSSDLADFIFYYEEMLLWIYKFETNGLNIEWLVPGEAGVSKRDMAMGKIAKYVNGTFSMCASLNIEDAKPKVLFFS